MANSSNSAIAVGQTSVAKYMAGEGRAIKG